MVLNKLYNMDCLQGMQSIPDESIDCVVTDCPYKISAGGVTIVAGDHEVGGILQKRTKTHGGFYAKNNKHVSYTRVLCDVRIVNEQNEELLPSAIRSGKMFCHNSIRFSEWLPEVYRVLKKGTHCYIMINARNLKELMVDASAAGFTFQNLLVWDKGNATPNKYYMQGAEFILMLSKRPARKINNMGSTTILHYKSVRKRQHPTQKPVELMAELIRNSTNKDEVVLDPFAGAGSTLVAASMLDRQYIGYEIDDKYYTIAQARLKMQNTTKL